MASKRMNFPERINQRRKDALARLEKRLELSDQEIASTAKRFKYAKEGVELNKRELDSYKKFLKSEIGKLKKKVMN